MRLRKIILQERTRCFLVENAAKKRSHTKWTKRKLIDPEFVPILRVGI